MYATITIIFFVFCFLFAQFSEIQDDAVVILGILSVLKYASVQRLLVLHKFVPNIVIDVDVGNLCVGLVFNICCCCHSKHLIRRLFTHGTPSESN